MLRPIFTGASSHQPTCEKESVYSVEIESILIAAARIHAVPLEAFVRCDRALGLFLSGSKSFFLFCLGLSPILSYELTPLFHVHGNWTEGSIWL